MRRVARLLAAVRALHEATPALAGYAPWPDDLVLQDLPPRAVAIAERLPRTAPEGNAQTNPVIDALCAAAPDLNWRQSYGADDVGSAFLETYGFVELYGPSGQYRSEQLRGYLGHWGPGLVYDWHAHEAEELYFTLAGRAVFSAKDAGSAEVAIGGVRSHRAWQPHKMLTEDAPYLCYALWRGDGMAGRPRLVAA